MNLVEWLQGLMTSFGASWVMWLLIALSVISVAIMLERGWFYFSLRDDIPRLAADLRRNLRSGQAEEALRALEASPSAEAAVVVPELLAPGDVVLVKASRGVGLELVCQALGAMDDDT